MTFLPKARIGYNLSPLLVMHESSLQMQECASQIDKDHYNMLKRDIDKLDCHKFSTSITNNIDRDIQACDIAMIKIKQFSQKLPSHEHMT
jgi:hypothetical protein